MKGKFEKEVWIPWYGKYLNMLSRGRLTREPDFLYTCWLMKWGFVAIVVIFIQVFFLLRVVGSCDVVVSLLVVTFGAFFSLCLLLMLDAYLSSEFFVFMEDGFIHYPTVSFTEKFLVKDIEEIVPFGDEEYPDLLIIKKNGDFGTFIPHWEMPEKHAKQLKDYMKSYFKQHGIIFNEITPRYYLVQLTWDNLSPEEVGKGNELMETALEKSPDDYQLIMTKAHWHRALDEGGKALPLFEQYLARHPDNKDALLGRIRSLCSLDRCEEAMECLDEAMPQFPDDVAFIETHGEVLAGLGRTEEAFSLLEKHIDKLERLWETITEEKEETLNRVSRQILMERKADILEKMGRQEDAETILKESKNIPYKDNKTRKIPGKRRKGAKRDMKR